MHEREKLKWKVVCQDNYLLYLHINHNDQLQYKCATSGRQNLQNIHPSVIGKSLFMQCMQNYLALTLNNGANHVSSFMYLWNEELKYLHYSFKKKKFCKALDLHLSGRLPSLLPNFMPFICIWLWKQNNYYKSS